MSDPDNIYRLYKKNRSSRERDSSVDNGSEASASTAEYDQASNDVDNEVDIDNLYRLYRNTRVPDPKEALATVFKLAEEKAAFDRTMERVQNQNRSEENADKSTLLKPHQQFTRQPASLRTMLAKLLRPIEPLAMRGVGVALVVFLCLTAILAAFYMKQPSPESEYQLALLDIVEAARSTSISGDTYSGKQIGSIVQKYLATTASAPLAFSQVSDASTESFKLGVASVNLQIAENILAEAQVEQIAKEIAATIAGSDYISPDKAANFAEGTPAIQVPTIAGVVTDKAWFFLGRDVQTLYLSAQVAIETDIHRPLQDALNAFQNSVAAIGLNTLSLPEQAAARELRSQLNKPQFSTSDLRAARNSARDLIALRQ